MSAVVFPRLAVIIVTLVTTVVVTSCGSLPADEIVRQAVDSYDKLRDYQGVVELRYSLAGAGQTVEIRQSFKKPDKHRLEFLSPEEIKGQATVFNGQTMWLYDPQDNEVIVFERAGRDIVGEDQRTLFSGIIAEINGAAAVKVAGRARLDGRPAYILELTPPNPRDQGFVQEEKVWLDGGTWLPLKVEAYDDTGKVVSSAVYKQVKVNTGLADDLFEMAAPEGATIVQGGAEPQVITIDEARQAVGFKLLVPSYLPAGLSPGQISRVGSGSDLAVVLDYSNEQTSLSITENRALPGAVGPPGMKQVDLGGMSVEVIQSDDFSIVHWISADVEFSITSNLALDEVGKIARSLR